MEMMSRPDLKAEGKGEEGEDGWYIRFLVFLIVPQDPLIAHCMGRFCLESIRRRTPHPLIGDGRIDIFSQDDLERKGCTPSSIPPISSNPFAFEHPNEELAHIIAQKLETHKHNKNATEALQAIQEELERREKCFKAMRRLWDSANLKTPYSICSIPSTLASLPQAKEVKITADTMMRHKAKHPEIDALDYSLIPYYVRKY